VAASAPGPRRSRRPMETPAIVDASHFKPTDEFQQWEQGTQGREKVRRNKETNDRMGGPPPKLRAYLGKRACVSSKACKQHPTKELAQGFKRLNLGPNRPRARGGNGARHHAKRELRGKDFPLSTVVPEQSEQVGIV